MNYLETVFNTYDYFQVLQTGTSPFPTLWNFCCWEDSVAQKHCKGDNNFKNKLKKRKGFDTQFSIGFLKENQFFFQILSLYQTQRYKEFLIPLIYKKGLLI